MKKTLWLAALAILGITTSAVAQVPGIIQYQGRVTSHGTNFIGVGSFKFAIIETAITGDSVWSNDGSSEDGSQPNKSVPVQVQDGLFIVGLGDNSLANMATIPASVFNYSSLKLRIWFNDGVGGFVALSPDQPITSVGFAMMSASVPNGAITESKLADGSVTAGKISANAVAGANVLNQTITGSKIVSNSVTSTEIADTLLLQRLDLGGPLWNGSLTLNAIGANGSRGLLSGDGNGSLFNLLFANSTTGAVLSARSPGAKLNLWDTFGNQTALLGAGVGGGELSLFQMSGALGVYLDADQSLYGNPNSSGGVIRVMDSAGNASIELVGAETSTTGAELRLRNAAGTPTMVFDAEYDTAGPRLDLYKGDGTSTMAFIPAGGDCTLAGGGLMRLGLFNGTNLGIDDNEILARNNGAAAPLYLNYQSGAVVYTTSLSVNTTTPAVGYSVSVNGKIICEELVVQNSVDWPDYVFADEYKLMPLEKLEASIDKNKHLPGIPSAQKIGEDGIPLGQIQKQMMEKIEELTLYLLQQNKRLEAQEKELANLRGQLGRN